MWLYLCGTFFSPSFVYIFIFILPGGAERELLLVNMIDIETFFFFLRNYGVFMSVGYTLVRIVILTTFYLLGLSHRIHLLWINFIFYTICYADNNLFPIIKFKIAVSSWSIGYKIVVILGSMKTRVICKIPEENFDMIEIRKLPFFQ